jgi:hypothetical protein
MIAQVEKKKGVFYILFIVYIFCEILKEREKKNV